MGEQGRVYEGILKGEGLSFGFVVSRFNEFICSKLLSGALDCLVTARRRPSRGRGGLGAGRLRDPAGRAAAWRAAAATTR